MKTEEVNAAIFGLIRAYKMLKDTKAAEDKPTETREIELLICEVFGWPRNITTENFQRNIKIQYQLLGYH